MKNITLLSLLALMLTACMGGSKNSNVSDDADSTDIVSLTKLEGEWVMHGYHDALVLDMSPAKAATKLNGYTGVCVGKAVGDSAFVFVMINNHEALSGYIYADKYDKNSGKFIVVSQDSSDTLHLSYNNNEAKVNSIKLTYKKKGETVEANQDFDFVAEYKGANDPCGLAAIEVLLADSWYVNDNTGKELCKINIDNFGNIKGWDGYTLVQVDTDFVLGGEDGLRLSSGNQNGAINYIASYMADRIELYESVPSLNLPYDKRGKLVYTLVRDNVGDN